MTDAVRSELAPSASSTGVTEPMREGLARAAALLRDGRLLESSTILVPILLVGVTHAAGPGLWLASAAYLAASAWVASHRPARGDRAQEERWTAARVLLGVTMVAAGQLLTGTTGLLAVMYLPSIALASFARTRMVVLAVALSITTQVAVEAVDRASLEEALQRGIGFAGAAVLVAYGTRREAARVQRARDRLRRAVMTDRRRARQIAGIEAVGRILAAGGPTAQALDGVVGSIISQFGYDYVSIYLGDEHGVELGAQHGYADAVEAFDGRRGIVGRVMRTGRPVFVTDVSSDPDYWGLNSDVTSEICVPLLADGEFLGFVNVESRRPLDSTDLRLMVSVADRLAAALIIGRDRVRLAERAELFRHLHEFGEAVNGTLQADELHRAIVQSVSSVVPADVAALHVLDHPSGRYLLAAIEGGSGVTVGAEARPGEGIAGRAIRGRTMIIDDAPSAFAVRPLAATLGLEDSMTPMLAASVPIARDGAVLGALTLMRTDRSSPFTVIESDALAMLAQQASLAIANVLLHAEVAELAVRDPLTGLFNRRYLDPALEQLFARRTRVAYEERVPLAAIMFDLDNFSDLNNAHGHQVGDEVLRAFGEVLRNRMRATDLVARFGGEEFCAVLYRATLDDAVRIADEVREQLAATPIAGISGEELSATVSAGCAAIGPEIESPTELLRAADVALYMAKRAGRDRVCAA